MYLLDTHVLLWARLDPAKLSKTHQQILTRPDAKKYFSSVSLWEISLKFALGKLELGGHNPDEFLVTAHELGLFVTSPEPDQYASFYRLQQIPNHKDPFDRMLIWQAIQQKMTLLSHDSKFGDYKPYGLALE
jgi:PIN domain nuclease of toxin-antitoxin system